MLKLINIVKNEDVMEADYIPEQSNQKAHIVLNSLTEDYQAENIDEYGHTYSRMAANGLLRTLEELKSGKISKIPAERLVMWC